MIPWVGFDADDTLWHCEHHFMASHDLYCEIVAPFTADLDEPETTARRTLAAVEAANIERFGYGVKGATLSMIEAALEVSRHRIDAAGIQRLIDRAKEMSEHPVELFEDVENTLAALRGHRLAMITKGDPIDQRRKIDASALATRFDSIDIIHDKTPHTYLDVFSRRGIDPSEFVMVGNSVRSDVLPVLEVGGWAILVPFADTWAHEHADAPTDHPRFVEVASLREIPDVVRAIGAAS